MYCIYDVYTKDKQCSIYNEYAWYITGISYPDWYMPGKYKVNIWYIKGIWCSHPYESTWALMSFFCEYLGLDVLFL